MKPHTGRQVGRLCAALAVTGLACCLVWLVRQLPKPPQQKVVVVDQAAAAVGVWTGATFAYVIPSRTSRDVVLINAGSDPAGTALHAALAARQRDAHDVRLILLTDGQTAHRAAVTQFPQAQVMVGAADVELAQGRRPPRASMPRLLARLAARPPPPQRLSPLLAATLLRCGDVEIETVSLPGYTPGSMAYAWQRTVFVGRSLRLSGGLATLWTWPFSENPGSNRRALERLREVHPAAFADSHYGIAPVGAGGAAKEAGSARLLGHTAITAGIG